MCRCSAHEEKSSSQSPCQLGIFLPSKGNFVMRAPLRACKHFGERKVVGASLELGQVGGGAKRGAEGMGTMYNSIPPDRRIPGATNAWMSESTFHQRMNLRPRSKMSRSRPVTAPLSVDSRPDNDTRPGDWFDGGFTNVTHPALYTHKLTNTVCWFPGARNSWGGVPGPDCRRSVGPPSYGRALGSFFEPPVAKSAPANLYQHSGLSPPSARTMRLEARGIVSRPNTAPVTSTSAAARRDGRGVEQAIKQLTSPKPYSAHSYRMTGPKDLGAIF